MASLARSEYTYTCGLTWLTIGLRDRGMSSGTLTSADPDALVDVVQGVCMAAVST
jgi:hypothetical protein